MKLALISILILWTTNPCVGQDIEKIIVTSHEANEPPTKPRPVEYRIDYKMDFDGDFVASHLKKDNKRRKLRETEEIESERVHSIRNWDVVKKVNFTASDLGIDRKMITLAAETSDHKLNFGFPDEIVLDVDSFQFCQNYKMSRSISAGGENISITILGKPRPMAQFTFHANDIGTGEFKLKEYILCYALLNDRIPEEFPHFNFFSKERLAEVVVYYQKTVECEGYYYEEYADRKHLTGKERRMKMGWDFIEYMRERIKKN